MARSSFASSGVIPTSPEQQFQATESFDVLQASKGITSQTRLQQQKRRFSIRDSEAFVSTAIAPNGWVAVATPSEIRLYNIECQNLNKDVTPTALIRPKSLSKGESVRAVAISDHLLAVVTHLRLIVYEYQETGNVEDNSLSEVRINQKAAWTPRSLSILQVDATDTDQRAAAWIAVGGEGVNGVRLYQYSQRPCWTALRNCHLTLKCPRNTGLVQSVGFSKFVRMNCFVVFAVTSENHVVCWSVHAQGIGKLHTLSTSHHLAEYAMSDVQQPHRGEVTAVNIFESPSERPYIFVAINQKHGSQLMRSFIAPLGAPSSQWRSLPGNTTGRQALSAAATRNGRFIVVVEDGALKLLALRGAFGGGLTCSDHTVEWASSLRETAKDICAISLAVKETLGCIEITGIDGRGHLLSARASVPGMPVTAPPSLTMRGFSMAELHGDHVVRTVPELCGKEISQARRVGLTVRSDWEPFGGG
ncbi:uncharacterized protein CC84DRAFT_1232961 [Paraphaeosphaeria sporulosa]|uniref:WD40 repeat-like protein n=1 Tax=Paraphaeosphaeria sporulosa TaxID=1460663 RepID=A0A177BVE6_9PLEO|nr:uncharacterized protein CC84DRAFT_1232961 [Paraphaeosphaeria sporulosa]OAF99453.1 hypothetical protein CC84DRAFT_1232961 [Paraphaeosphaeria sporulosa]